MKLPVIIPVKLLYYNTIYVYVKDRDRDFEYSVTVKILSSILGNDKIKDLLLYLDKPVEITNTDFIAINGYGMKQISYR
jgi:hypothetical protein